MKFDTRYARLFIWVDPEDCEPPHGLDLEPGSRDSLKVEMLQEAFEKEGFDMSEPCLIGYPNEGRIQLLSGTHRHEAARRAGIKLPVHLVLRSVVEALWGTEEWPNVIKDVPVRDLECVEISNSPWAPALADRVNVQYDIPEH